MKINYKSIFLVIISTVCINFIQACAHVKSADNTIKKRYTNFGVARLSDDWSRKSFRNADLFFQHKKGDATIFINAQCDKLSDSPLEALLAQILTGMGKYETLSEKRIQVGDREALQAEIKVNLDGVNRYLRMVVLRKNRCVYDAVLSSSSNSLELAQDFDEMIKSFWAEAEL